MASRKRRAQLPPWLQGVTVKKGVPVKNEQTKSSENHVDNSTKNNAKKDTTDSCNADKNKDTSKPDSVNPSDRSAAFSMSDTLNRCRKEEIPSDDLDPEQKWTAEKAVEMSYEEFSFKGSIIYSHNTDDCNLICEDLISSLVVDKEVVVGFDTEWPVTYAKGKQAKTALIQVCLSTEKCYLFHVSCMAKFPVMLKNLLEMHNVKKVGMNVENDFWKLDVDYDIKARDIIKQSLVELRTLANKKLRSAENWSLEGLAKNAMHIRIAKDPNVRKCDWSQFPLPEVQQRYAATDAIVSLMLYRKLTEK